MGSLSYGFDLKRYEDSFIIQDQTKAIASETTANLSETIILPFQHRQIPFFNINSFFFFYMTVIHFFCVSMLLVFGNKQMVTKIFQLICWSWT
jgi:hypothetical protein